MDFLTDPIFTDLGRSDFIGGIDNEALDFGQLEQFMHASVPVAAATNIVSNDIACCVASGVAKDDPEGTTNPNSSSPTNRHIATISSRVSLANVTTPISTALATVAAAVSNNTHSQLPESPPDSGSEPPYSPLQESHGLTLTTRDVSSAASSTVSMFCSGLSSTLTHSITSPQQAPSTSGLMSPQFAPSHHSQNLLHSQHASSNNQFPHHHNSSHQYSLNNHRISMEGNSTEISIKPESGLIMHSPNLTTPPLQSANDTRIDIPMQQQQQQQQQHGPQSQVLFQSGCLTMTSNTDAVDFNSKTTTAGLYGSCSELQHLRTNTDGTLDQAAIYLMNPETSTPRVHVIGTSTPQTHSNRSSAPSTPIHRSSTRKRKMSTQLDYVDFAAIKPDPSLRNSPVANDCTLQYTFTPDGNKGKIGSTSPVTVSLPTSSADLVGTPVQSTASLSPALSTVNSNQDNSMDGSVAPGSSNGGDNGDMNALTPCIRFSPFQPQNWHKLCDQNLQELSMVYYRVDADKGFNFSVSDDAFVCQKKNHFQVTCHARLQGEARFVKTPSGLEKIKSFHLHFYGVKLESPNQTIRVEQSQSDRSKKPFHPVPIDLQSHIVSKITVGRLHFSETTNNNMRKKGRPNPEQRYFQLVVALHVHTLSGNFPIIIQSSERIIVRASNPGQFESDVDPCWQRGITQDSVFHAGRVGINTDRPDESLVVHGNLKVSGHIVQPSDSRAKQEIAELDTSVQLRNLQKIRIVRYRYEPEFAVHSGLKRSSSTGSEEIVDTGVIAQEVREVIPDAVQEAGSITLPNGNVIENFLLVNKDRILMENIGAVKELCKVTGSLESRIQNLEVMNNRLLRAKEYDQRTFLQRQAYLAKEKETCSNRNLQIIIFLLVIIMAACLIAVSTLYFLEHNKQHHSYKLLQLHQQYPGVNYHDTKQLTEQERELMNLRNLLHSNITKNYSNWPDYLFGWPTTAKPLQLNSPQSSLHPPTTKPPTVAHVYGRQGQEIIYNESNEFYTTNGRTDELAVVMEKPVVNLHALQFLQEPYRVSTSAPPPLRLNKTNSSKNKHKWPLPQVVLRTVPGLQPLSGNGLLRDVAPVAGNIVEELSVTTARSLGTSYAETIKLNGTTSEKQRGELISQDIENNSIDTDARRELRKKLPLPKSVSVISLVIPSPNGVSHGEGTADNKESHTDAQSTTPSTNGAQLRTSVASESAGVVSNIYGIISESTASIALTTKRTIASIEERTFTPESAATPLSNKSQGVLDSLLDTSDALDLQNLNGNNESADNPIAALFGIDLPGGADTGLGPDSANEDHSVRSNIWMQRTIMELESFGTPQQCKELTSLRDDVANCQSLCFEGANQLSAPRKSFLTSNVGNKNPIDENGGSILFQNIADAALNVDTMPNVGTPSNILKSAESNLVETKLNVSTVASGKMSHATQAIAKQAPAEHQTGEGVSGTSLNSDGNSGDLKHLLTSTKLSDDLSGFSGTLSIVAHRPPTTFNCWKISTTILSSNINRSYASDEFCPNNGRSLNLTYIIPLSKYFKGPNFEIRFRSSKPLLWVICHDSDNAKPKTNHLILSIGEKDRHLTRHHNTSTLIITVPSHGFFVRSLQLRVSEELTKENLCQQQADESNNLLEYNIRILRDCD